MAIVPEIPEAAAEKWQVPGQAGQHRETLFQNKNRKSTGQCAWVVSLIARNPKAQQKNLLSETLLNLKKHNS